MESKFMSRRRRLSESRAAATAIPVSDIRRQEWLLEEASELLLVLDGDGAEAMRVVGAVLGREAEDGEELIRQGLQRTRGERRVDAEQEMGPLGAVWSRAAALRERLAGVRTGECYLPWWLRDAEPSEVASVFARHAGFPDAPEKRDEYAGLPMRESAPALALITDFLEGA